MVSVEIVEPAGEEDREAAGEAGQSEAAAKANQANHGCAAFAWVRCTVPYEQWEAVRDALAADYICTSSSSTTSPLSTPPSSSTNRTRSSSSSAKGCSGPWHLRDAGSDIALEPP